MAENTSISWARHTWNPVMGCTKISPACDGCYAAHLMDTRLGKVKWGGERVRTSAQTWKTPFKWQRQAEKDGDRPFIFCSSLSDVFDNQWPAAWRADAFDVMRQTPNLVYLLLTKRPQNIIKLAEAAGGLPRNAALGSTCEDQPRADKNVPHLIHAAIETPALFTFVSVEPMLSRVNLRNLPTGPLADVFYGNERFDALHQTLPWRIDWVITGGETDQGAHKARPSHPDWFRDLRDQCEATGTAYHHKQNGEYVSVSEVAGPGVHFKFPDGATVRRIGKSLSGRTIDGRVHDAFPRIAA